MTSAPICFNPFMMNCSYNPFMAESLMPDSAFMQSLWTFPQMNFMQPPTFMPSLWTFPQMNFVQNPTFMPSLWTFPQMNFIPQNNIFGNTKQNFDIFSYFSNMNFDDYNYSQQPQKPKKSFIKMIEDYLKNSKSSKTAKSKSQKTKDKENPVKPEASGEAERTDRTDRTDRADKVQQAGRSERTYNTDKAQQTGRSERTDNTDKARQAGRSERADKADRAQQARRSKRANNAQRTKGSDRPAKPVKPDNTAVNINLSDRELAEIGFDTAELREKWKHLTPKMKESLIKLNRYAKSKGIKISYNSTYRSTAEQRRLHEKDPKNAAKPGTSRHEQGRAVDIRVTGNKGKNLKLLGKYWESLGKGHRWGGNFRTWKKEPWHFDVA